jgi:hypothetical protein
MIHKLGLFNLNLTVVNDARGGARGRPASWYQRRCYRSSPVELAETLVVGVIGLQDPTQMDGSEGQWEQ